MLNANYSPMHEIINNNAVLGMTQRTSPYAQPALSANHTECVSRFLLPRC